MRRRSEQEQYYCYSLSVVWKNAVASITERLFDVLKIGGNLAAFKTKPLLRLKKLHHFAGFKGWPLECNFLLLLLLAIVEVAMRQDWLFDRRGGLGHEVA